MRGYIEEKKNDLENFVQIYVNNFVKCKDYFNPKHFFTSNPNIHLCFD